MSPYASLAPPLVTQVVREQRGEAILPRPDGFVRDGEALCQQHLGQITPAEFVPQAPEHHAQHDVRGRLHVADGRARPLVVGAPAGRGDRGTGDSPTPSPAPAPVSRPPGNTDSPSSLPPYTARKGAGYLTRYSPLPLILSSDASTAMARAAGRHPPNCSGSVPTNTPLVPSGVFAPVRTSRRRRTLGPDRSRFEPTTRCAASSHPCA